MKLLFDLNVTQPNRSGLAHGGGKYGEIVFFYLAENKKDFSCFYDSSKKMNPAIIECCKTKNIELFDIKDYASLRQLLVNQKFTIVYSAIPNYFHNIYTDNCRFVGTIHGLRDLELLDDKFISKYKDISYKDKIRYLVRRYFPSKYNKLGKKKFEQLFSNKNFKFVSVSEHTKYSLLTYFPKMKKENLHVFYSPSTSPKIKPKPYSNDKYFLLVSANRWAKNNLRAIQAFDELFSDHSNLDFKVVITGAKESDFKYRIKNKKHFDFLGYVSEEVLNSLYSGAYCFVYPSLNEGFGYPPIEAMNYGVPVLSSPYSSIYEVCGDAAIYFNPCSIDEMKNRILMILDDTIYQSYQHRSRERFSFIKERQDKDLVALVDYIYSAI